MSKEIEEIFKEWLKEKPMAKILVTKNSQMGYIIEFAEYYSKQKIEQLEKENTKLKERESELFNMLDTINGIMWESYCVKDRVFGRKQGKSIMLVLEKWANKF